jgi:polysaccharide biosynthesis transport protein
VQEPVPYWTQNGSPPVPYSRAGVGPTAYAREENSELWEYWNVIFRHWRLIASLFLASVLCAALVVFSMTPIYTGVSTILIERQTPQVLEANKEQIDADSASFYKTQYELLKSPTLIASVVRELALDKNPYFTGRSTSKGGIAASLTPASVGSLFSSGDERVVSRDNNPQDPAGAESADSAQAIPPAAVNFVEPETGKVQQTADAMPPVQSVSAPATDPVASAPDPPAQRTIATAPIPAVRPLVDAAEINPQIMRVYTAGLAIRPEFDTRLTVVAFSSPDPVLAARITNAHVRAFIRAGYQLHTQSSEMAQRFLTAQLGELEQRLERSEAALNDYRRARGIVAFSLDDKDKMMSERMEDLNRALLQAEENRIALEADVQTIKANDYDAVPEVVNSTLIQHLKVEASRLSGQYTNLANEYTPSYPPLIQLRAQLMEERKRLQQETLGVVNSIRSRYETAVKREAELRTEFEQEKAHVMSLKEASLRDAVLAREVETNQILYKNVLERIKVLGVASEAHVTNVSVVDVAHVPSIPSSPKKRLSIALAGFLSLLVGIGLAFVIEGSHRGLKNADEVQRFLQLPNLATVIHIPSSGEKRSLSASLASKLLPGDKPRLGNIAGRSELLPARSMLAAASEAYRAVRTGILLSRAGSPPRTVLFTSAIPGEGKSLTAVNTAIVFAHMHDRVLLIDADLRRPRCHEIFAQENRVGLAEVLSGVEELEDAIQPTSVKGLFLLAAGQSPPNPSELLASKKMRDVLEAAMGEYEYVLLDSAPILPVSDSVIISTQVEGTILVTESSTAKPFVRDACTRLSYVGAKMLGVVLNNVDPEYQRYYAPYMYTTPDHFA